MPGVKELADKLIDRFDATSSMKIEKALIQILMAGGLPKWQAVEEAEKYSPRVIQNLQQRLPQELNFDFSQNDPYMLIGKRRTRPSDNIAARYARDVFEHVPEVVKAMSNLDPNQFEVLCALSMLIADAVEAHALKTNDEGGIDFFGRIPVKRHIEGVPQELLRTSFLDWKLLVLGQAKCFSPEIRIGRGEIQKFSAQIRDCLRKYRDCPDPPRHRVPDSYYVEEEPCLPLFITSASFSDRVPGSALSHGIRLVDGRELAEFLIFHRIGVVDSGGKTSFSRDKFVQWVNENNHKVDVKQLNARG